MYGIVLIKSIAICVCYDCCMQLSMQYVTSVYHSQELLADSRAVRRAVYVCQAEKQKQTHHVTHPVLSCHTC